MVNIEEGLRAFEHNSLFPLSPKPLTSLMARTGKRDVCVCSCGGNDEKYQQPSEGPLAVRGALLKPITCFLQRASESLNMSKSELIFPESLSECSAWLIPTHISYMHFVACCVCM